MLLLNIGRISISLIHADRVVWRASKDKKFSVHSLYNEVMHNIASHDQIIIPDVWLNLCPAKTELFLWFALLEKLPTRDHLFSIGLSTLAMNKCVFFVILAKLMIISYYCSIRVSVCGCFFTSGGVLRL